MRDILPQQMIKRQFVMDTMREVFESFGFEPLQTAVLELKETLIGKYGPDAEKLIYYAQHSQGSEELAMRYDLTVPLCRVAAMYPDLAKPFKRYQIAPVWRAERPQKGRYREFYQCDVDVVGSKSMLADAEIINVLYQILKRLGFKQFRTLLNNRKILKGLGEYVGIPAEQAGTLYRSIDKLDKIGIAGVKEELQAGGICEEAISRLLDILQIRGSNSEMIAALRERLSRYPQAMEGLDELAEIVSYLRALGIPEENVQVSFAMVRGLDYYTGPIYETMVDEPKIGSITGGGRYDELIGLFTNQSFPTTGTSLGIERIIDVMDELNMFPPSIRPTVTEVLVTIFDAQNAGPALSLASELRAAGIKTELYFEPDSLGKQIKYAVKKGIPYLTILGPDELAAGKVALRDLSQGKQEMVARMDLVAALRNR
jgi:histidyl-tRNA synthetase